MVGHSPPQQETHGFNEQDECVPVSTGRYGSASQIFFNVIKILLFMLRALH